MNRGVTYSLLLHLTAVLVARLDFSNLFRNNEVVSVVPISVDLSQVKISEVTNLPPESEEKPKEEEPPPPEEKAEKAPEPPKYVPPSEEVKPEPKPIPPPEEKPSGMELKEPEEKQDKKPPKEEPKEAKTPPPKPKPKPYKAPKPKPKNEDSLSSLLASVGQIEKNLKPKTNNTEETKKPVTGGIKGGTGGFLGRELTISEKDALASKLRACWNLDPGAKGIKDMIIEIRAHLNPDGTVREVDILNNKSDPFFRAVAESAARAVRICAPYDLLVEKHGDKYDLWKSLFLRFNPLDGGIS